MAGKAAASSGKAPSAIGTLTQPFVSALAPHIAEHVVAPVVHAVIAGPGTSTPGQSSGSSFGGPDRNRRAKPDANPYPSKSTSIRSVDDDVVMLADPLPRINPYNESGLGENCVFISMAYLLDTHATEIKAREIVKITGQMQPDDGSGGINDADLSRILVEVQRELKVEYVLEKWDPAKGLQFWTSKLGSRFAILYERHSTTVPCRYKAGGNPGPGDQPGSTRCIVADSKDAKYRQANKISGHCVVYDSKRPPYPPAFFDFQESGLPVPNLKEGDLWIEEHGAFAFGFPKLK